MIVMSKNKIARLVQASVTSAVLLVQSAAASILTDPAYGTKPIYDTLGTFTIMESLDVKNGKAYVNAGANIVSVNISNTTASIIGTLPSNVTVAYLKWRDNTLHAAYGTSFNFPFPGRHGVIESGAYVNYGSNDGIYDAAVTGDGTLYVIANPGAAGSKVFRFIPVSTSLVEVISVGGFSGPIAFDSYNNLYVGEQSFGDEKILRFTAAQLAGGGLTAADGETVIATGSTYICMDENDRLYVTSGYGNYLSVYDVVRKVLVRSVAVDSASGYGIGRMAWDRTNKKLITIHTDFNSYDSTLNAIGFSDMYEGVAGTSTVFQGWVAGYSSYNRPSTNSGGYARDNDGNPSSVRDAVVGAPASFDPDEFPVGHILSLGNGGSIVLEMDDAIVNKPGPDFAVFENGFEFNGIFAELAFVEVATTTNAWARFPVTSFSTNSLAAFATINATHVDGVAGKHALEYGTPFDLAWLINDTNVLSGAVNLQQITYVRIVDVEGGGVSVDQFGHAIYDSFAIGNASADGFDLRGVGVIHTAGASLEKNGNEMTLSWYGYSGRTYQPQSYNGNSWSNYDIPVAGTGGWHRVTLPTGNDTAMWRVEQTIVAAP